MPTTSPRASMRAEPESPGRRLGGQLQHLAAGGCAVVDVAAGGVDLAGHRERRDAQRLATGVAEHAADLPGARGCGNGEGWSVETLHAEQGQVPGRVEGHHDGTEPTAVVPLDLARALARHDVGVGDHQVVGHDPTAAVLDPAARHALHLHDRSGRRAGHGVGEAALGRRVSNRRSGVERVEHLRVVVRSDERAEGLAEVGGRRQLVVDDPGHRRPGRELARPPRGLRQHREDHPGQRDQADHAGDRAQDAVGAPPPRAPAGRVRGGYRPRARRPGRWRRRRRPPRPSPARRGRGRPGRSARAPEAAPGCPPRGRRPAPATTARVS